MGRRSLGWLTVHSCMTYGRNPAAIGVILERPDTKGLSLMCYAVELVLCKEPGGLFHFCPYYPMICPSFLPLLLVLLFSLYLFLSSPLDFFLPLNFLIHTHNCTFLRTKGQFVVTIPSRWDVHNWIINGSGHLNLPVCGSCAQSLPSSDAATKEASLLRTDSVVFES